MTELQAASEAIAHQITYGEAHSALAGRLRRKLLRKTEYVRATTAFEADWAGIAQVTVNDALIRQTGTSC